MKKLLLFGLGLLIVLFAARKLVLPKIAERGFERVLSERLGAPTAQLEDGIHVYICGAGSPLFDAKRSGPCIAVQAGEKSFIFDAGTKGSQNLAPMGFTVDKVEGIFLTHLHSDHIDGLGQMLLGTWINSGRTEPTKVYGPVGTSQVVDGFNMAYQIDSTYRTAHHGVAVANPASFGAIAHEIKLVNGSKVVYDNDGVKITATMVTHEPVHPAFGYRIDYKDRSIYISGDTAYDIRIAGYAKDVDVMFHEALNMEMVQTMEGIAKKNGAKGLEKILFDIQDYHTSPVDAAKTAKQANARDLVLYHIVPMLPNDLLIPVFVKGTNAEFDGKITVSQDGTIVRLPVDSDAIIYEDGMANFR
ncbi:MAG: MBL fold metallo-hydrolase [Hellea sp.]|nr:MBL fold metallo-hydrolase [Hellea sp.]